MREVNYLLIGGGVASYEAARSLRNANRNKSILMVSNEPYPPYNRTMLSKDFMKGEAESASLFLMPEESYDEQSIDLILSTSVEGLDVDAKTARLSSGDEVKYDKALIATGGDPIRIRLPGTELQGIHYLRTIDDAAAISKDARKGGRAVIIGAGFIGLEVAVALTELGVDVDVIEMMPHIWARFTDEELAGYFQERCTKEGITFHTEEKVTGIKGNSGVSAVMTESGKEFPCDMVCIGVGIRPAIKLAEDAGLEIDNGIKVNSYLETSNPDVYAAGDVANYPDKLFGTRRRVEHWAHARFSGRIAGENMSGARREYDLLSHVWSDIFDLHLEFAGDESEHDETILRGKLEDKSFTVFYLKDSVPKAYFAVNVDPREIGDLNKLILSKKSLAGKTEKLQNKDFPIGELLE